jgi:hypothetical protein
MVKHISLFKNNSIAYPVKYRHRVIHLKLFNDAFLTAMFIQHRTIRYHEWCMGTDFQKQVLVAFLKTIAAFSWNG